MTLLVDQVLTWMPAGQNDDSAAHAIRANLNEIATKTAFDTAVTDVQNILNGSGTVHERASSAVLQSIASREAAQSTGVLAAHETFDIAALEATVQTSPRLLTTMARAQNKALNAFDVGLSITMPLDGDSVFLTSPNALTGLRVEAVGESPPFATTGEARGTLNGGVNLDQAFVPTPRFGLCVEPASRLSSLRDSIEQRLSLISHNLGPTGLRIRSTQGAASSQTTSEFRFEYLLDRAKSTLGAAQQLEAAMASAIAQRDEEQYRLLKASQGAALGQVNVGISLSGVQAATQSLTVARAQTQQSSFSQSWYSDLRAHGLSKLEKEAIRPESDGESFWRTAAIFGSIVLATAGTIATAGAGGLAFAVAAGAAASALGSDNQAQANLTRSQNTQKAAYKRRAQEWRYQELSAKHGVEIGLQQEIFARIQINTQRLQLSASQLQLQFAFDELNFLQNKESSAALYAWMVSKLRTYYRSVLLETTALARAAHSQLVFQRQTQIPNPISSDYWQDLADPESMGRNGVTGSSRLLQDLTQLERLARESTKRRLHVRKTFSLRAFAPDQLIRLQQEGLLSFAARLEDYDQDFPELSHRLIESVSFSILGLTPSTGIVASAVGAGVSKTQTENGRSEIFVLRPYQSITFTGMVDQNGISTLNPQGELLRPFEGLGVETEIHLQIPRAANLWDLNSIADVLVTVEYSALKSQEKYRRTVARLDSKRSFSPSFSLRDDFVDQWYEVLQSTGVIPPFKFIIEDQDFAPSLSDLTVRQARLLFIEQDEQTLGSCDVVLDFNNSGLPSTATGTGGLFSTRQFGSWAEVISQSPVGDWEFTLPLGPGGSSHPLRQIIDDERLVDIVLVLEVEATTPAWPETL